MATEAELRARIEEAETLGISLKRFDGWEPTTVTEYEYDDAGRLIRSVTTPETEWDDTERAWMMALATYRANRCPHCGGDMDETTKPANEDRYHRLEPIQCFRCVEFARAQQDYKDLPNSHTLLHRVELKRRR